MARAARRHDTLASRTAGIDDPVEDGARTGSHVLTIDGPGMVANVYEGYGGTVSYEIVLDDGLGGGEYRSGDVIAILGDLDEMTVSARRYSGVPMACDDCGSPAESSTAGGPEGHRMLCDDCRAKRGKTPRKTAAGEFTVRKFNGILTIDGKQFRGDYWVGMQLPADHDPDDFTMEEVTHRYVSRRGLDIAIANGTAWLPGHGPKTAKTGAEFDRARATDTCVFCREPVMFDDDSEMYLGADSWMWCPARDGMEPHEVDEFRYGARSLGVDWVMPGKKRPFATSTQATSDMIRILGEDGHTVQSAHDALLYDPEGKAILAAFIAAGYVNTPLTDLVGGNMVQDQVKKATLQFWEDEGDYDEDEDFDDLGPPPVMSVGVYDIGPDGSGPQVARIDLFTNTLYIGEGPGRTSLAMPTFPSKEQAEAWATAQVQRYGKTAKFEQGRDSRTAARAPLPLLSPEELHAQGLRTAADSYPELAEILWERPDLIETQPAASMPRRLTLGAKTGATKAKPKKRLPTGDKDDPPWLQAPGPEANPIKRSLTDKSQPWWWRKMVGPALDRVNDNLQPAYQIQTDEDARRSATDVHPWCRFRDRGECMFPKEFDEAGSKAAGYPVWIPFDRGPCPWVTFDQQKFDCKVSEPSPYSGEKQRYPMAVKSWEDGGQRTASVPVSITPKREASWTDVRTKAKRIRQSGGVRIVSALAGVVTAEVHGDTGNYTATVTTVPGTNQVAISTCSCPWETYRWARSGPWKDLEGRACAHITALLYEMQSRKMFGGEITEDVATPEWRTSEPSLEAPKSMPGPWRLDEPTPKPVEYAAALQAHRRALVVQRTALDVHARLDPRVDPQVGALALALASLDVVAGQVAAGDVLDAPCLVSLAGLTRRVGSFWAQVDGRIVQVDAIDDDGEAWLGETPVPTERLIYPTFHPTISLYGSRTAAVATDEAALLELAEAHEVGKYTHAGLIVKALDSGRVLMTQRTPYHHDDEGTYGTWEFPGGGIDEGETPLDAALREFTEETGLQLPAAWDMPGCYANETYLGIVCVVPNEAWTTDASLLDRETMGIGWFDPDHIQDAEFVRTEVAETTEWDGIHEAHLAVKRYLIVTLGPSKWKITDRDTNTSWITDTCPKCMDMQGPGDPPAIGCYCDQNGCRCKSQQWEFESKLAAKGDRFSDFERGQRVIVKGHPDEPGTVVRLQGQFNVYTKGYVWISFDNDPENLAPYPFGDVQILRDEGGNPITAARKGDGVDTCKYCGSDSLWGNFFDKDGFGTDTDADGAKWDLLCADCGKFQMRRNPKTASGWREPRPGYWLDNDDGELKCGVVERDKVTDPAKYAAEFGDAPFGWYRFFFVDGVPQRKKGTAKSLDEAKTKALAAGEKQDAAWKAVQDASMQRYRDTGVFPVEAAAAHKLEEIISVGTSGAYVVSCVCGWTVRVEGTFDTRKRAMKALAEHKAQATGKTAAFTGFEVYGPNRPTDTKDKYAKAWSVRVRSGSLVKSFWFRDEADATAFADAAREQQAVPALGTAMYASLSQQEEDILTDIAAQNVAANWPEDVHMEFVRREGPVSRAEDTRLDTVIPNPDAYFDPANFYEGLTDEHQHTGVEVPRNVLSAVDADVTWPEEAILHDEPEPALPEAYGELGDGIQDPDSFHGAPVVPSSIDGRMDTRDTDMLTTGTDPQFSQPFVPGDQRLAWLAEGGLGGDDEIAAAASAHLAKTALKDFSAAEQQSLIGEGEDEGRGARNTDRLDIAGTHYEGVGSDVSDAELLW